MALDAHELSAGLFTRGLTNLKTQLASAEAHAAAGGGEAALLTARLAGEGPAPASYAPRDLHGFTLAAQVHWAAEGARLAVAHLLGAPGAPATDVATSFAGLHRHLDATVAYFQGVAPADLAAGLERPIVIEHPRGATGARGGRFLVAFAIPHFYYHLTSAYGIMRNQGVPLTMGDFLGHWGAE